MRPAQKVCILAEIQKKTFVTLATGVLFLPRFRIELIFELS